MKYWLVKTEPSEWSWADQRAAGGGAAPWTGVRNAQAAGSLRLMRKGDRVLFYHSGAEKQIVGIASVAREHYPDPTDPAGRSVAIDLKALRTLARPVRLSQIKADKRLGQLALVRQPRLSVMPVDAAAWMIILKLAGDET